SGRAAKSPPASRSSSAKLLCTLVASRLIELAMSAWISGSSAPGTLNSALAGIMRAHSAASAAFSRSVKVGSPQAGGGLAMVPDMVRSSVKQRGEALLHLIGDVEREGLDGGRGINAA